MNKRIEKRFQKFRRAQAKLHADGNDILRDVLDQLHRMGAECYLQIAPPTGYFLANIAIPREEYRKVLFNGQDGVTFKWNPEEYYHPLPWEWILISRNEDRFIDMPARRRDIEDYTTFADVELENIEQGFKPLAIIYRHDDDPIEIDNTVLRILPLVVDLSPPGGITNFRREQPARSPYWPGWQEGHMDW